jgi:PAS domain S-box-containing protein
MGAPRGIRGSDVSRASARADLRCTGATALPAEIGNQLPILEASPNAIVAVDDRGLISYANPQAEAMFGAVARDLVGNPIELLVASRVESRHVAHRNAFIANPLARPMGIGLDLAGRRSDGSEFPVEISLSPVPMADGLQVFATVVDITARKAVEQALAESERRFRTVLEASPNPIVGVDQTATITYANPQVQDAFGYTPEELLGLPIETLLPERVRSRHVAHRDLFIERPIARPMGIGLDLSGRRKDGQEFPVEISLAPVETPEGLLVFATVVDISARKAVEAQLLQSQKLESIGRLAGGVAHDFNNILFAINGYTELLMEDLAAAPPDDLSEVRQSLVAIQGAADRGANLTMQLLAFSSQQIVTQKIVDPVAGIGALEPMLRRLIGENIQLQVIAKGPSGRLRIDPGQLDQIVMNLVVNARDAMPTGGSVTIEIGTTEFEEAYALDHFEVTPGSYVMVAVSDDGHGMDRETREHIFEPFFTTKGLGLGTGLGLATIYGIVRQAGGHIWLYSEPGRGSTFKVYLPRVDAAPTAEAAPATDDPGQGSGSVLLVEDEHAVRDMTRRVLQRAGYTVLATENASSAINAIEKAADPFEVLVTDVVMPGMSGIELASWMLDRHPETAIVLLSGYTADSLDLERLMARGARFVTKPLSTREVLRAIRDARAALGPAPTPVQRP